MSQSYGPPQSVTGIALPFFLITITILDIIHNPALLFKNTMFQRLDSASGFRWNVLRWAQYSLSVWTPGHKLIDLTFFYDAHI
jgi:hypothetical protein